MGLRELFLEPIAYFVCLTLPLVNVVAQRLLRLAVAVLAGVVDLCQRAHYMVIGELNAALRFVGHVAIGARNAALGMNPQLVDFKIGVLRL